MEMGSAPTPARRRPQDALAALLRHPMRAVTESPHLRALAALPPLLLRGPSMMAALNARGRYLP